MKLDLLQEEEGGGGTMSRPDEAAKKGFWDLNVVEILYDQKWVLEPMLGAEYLLDEGQMCYLVFYPRRE